MKPKEVVSSGERAGREGRPPLHLGPRPCLSACLPPSLAPRSRTCRPGSEDVLAGKRDPSEARSASAPDVDPARPHFLLYPSYDSFSSIDV